MADFRTMALTVKGWISGADVQKELADALPQTLGITPTRFIRTFYTALMRTPRLFQATRESLLGCMLVSAQLGIEPILGRAAVIPYANYKKKGPDGKPVLEAQFQLMVYGWVELARRVAKVVITACVVHAKDTFELELGDNPRILHKPFVPGMGGTSIDDDAGEPIGAYTIWKYADGRRTSKWMPVKEIFDIRDKFAKGLDKPDSPWNTREEEMMMKTVIKNHAKLQELHTDLQRAIELDNRAETGVSQMDLLVRGGIDELAQNAEALSEGPDTIEEEPEAGGDVDLAASEVFYSEMAEAAGTTITMVQEFVAGIAKRTKKDEATLISTAREQKEGFLSGLRNYVKKAQPKEKPKPKPKAEEKQESMFAASDDGPVQPELDEFDMQVSFYQESLPPAIFNKICKAVGVKVDELDSTPPEFYGRILDMLKSELDKLNA